MTSHAWLQRRFEDQLKVVRHEGTHSDRRGKEEEDSETTNRRHDGRNRSKRLIKHKKREKDEKEVNRREEKRVMKTVQRMIQ